MIIIIVTFCCSLTSPLTVSAVSEGSPSMLTTTTQGHCWSCTNTVQLSLHKIEEKGNNGFFQGHPDILSGQDLLFQWGGKVWWWQVGNCSEIMTPLWGCWPPFPLEIVKLDPSHCLAPNTAHFSRCHFSMIIIRAVDFLYMPDTMIEEARNVSVNLHGEHGRYFMFSDIVLHGTHTSF